MLRYCLPFLICASLCASEKKLAKQEEKKFVLKEGENTFTIARGYFPYIDTLMTFSSEEQVGTAEKPKKLSEFNIDIINQKALTTLQKLIDNINEKDSTFFTVSLPYWPRYERYIFPLQWETIVKELLLDTMPVKELVDLAHAADFLLSNPLRLLLLDILADRLIEGESKDEPISMESPNLDVMLAQIIISNIFTGLKAGAF